jgi:hypothetical protein
MGQVGYRISNGHSGRAHWRFVPCTDSCVAVILLYSIEDEPRIFQNLTAHALAPFLRHRRLGSPQHYRLYFAFAKPIGALKDDDVQSFLALSDNAPDRARDRFVQFASTARPQGGVMAEVLIDRLITWVDRIQPATVPAIFRAFAFALDDVARQTRRGDFGEHKAWHLDKR